MLRRADGLGQRALSKNSNICDGSINTVQNILLSHSEGRSSTARVHQ